MSNKIMISLIVLSGWLGVGAQAAEPRVIYPLVVTPSAKTVAVGNKFALSPSGGVAPYTLSIISGGGSINAVHRLFTAPSVPGTTVIQLSDAAGTKVNAEVTINPRLSISPASPMVVQGSEITFSGLQGVAPYSFSVLSGGGSVDATSGVYRAPSTPGSARVMVKDSMSNTSIAGVRIVSPVSAWPAAVQLAIKNTYRFSGRGGIPPYKFSVSSGGGVVNVLTGEYSAPDTATYARVMVTDSTGASSEAVVTVNPKLEITPSSLTLLLGTKGMFAGIGGVPPYIFYMKSGRGLVDRKTGVYTAPSIPAREVLRIQDSLGNFSDASITVNQKMSISPAKLTLAVGNKSVLKVLGGVPSFAATVITGGGEAGPGALPNTLSYTAPLATGVAIIRATDATGGSVDVPVTINPPLVACASPPILIPAMKVTIQPSGGAAPYAFSMLFGGGIVLSPWGVYIAPSSPGKAGVLVKDSAGNSSTCEITINPPLSVTPASANIAINQTKYLSASGGIPPYRYSISFGGGSIDKDTGLFTAPNKAGATTVTVQDSVNKKAHSKLNVFVPEALDLSFGTGGVVYSDLESELDFANSAAFQKDSKLVVVGSASVGDDSEFAVLRYLSDGKLDGGFGQDGYVLSDFGSDLETARAIAIQPDGKILVAGSSASHIAMLRLNGDGTLDTSFGSMGQVLTDPGSPAEVVDMELSSSDGRIMVAATANGGFSIMRYEVNGALDGAFGLEGVATITFDGFASASAMSVQPDGKMIVAGTSGAGFALGRFMADGSIDVSFGLDGRVLTSSDSLGAIVGRTVAMQPDGKIIVGGHAEKAFIVARYNMDGSMDTSFGGGSGIVKASLGQADSYAYSMMLDQAGKILLAGKSFNGSNYESIVLGFNPDGTIDSSFGKSGVLRASFGHGDSAVMAIVPQSSQDTFVTVGFSMEDQDADITLARFWR